MSVALAGLAMGFLGSSHCIGMCGGIAAALSAAPRRDGAGATRDAMATAVTQNLGRVASYGAAGALAGAFGAAFSGLGGADGMFALRAVAALLIVATGLYLAGLSAAVTRIEALGGALWRRLGPVAGRLRRSDSALAAFAFGALWGWLPCGLVYSALAVAAASGSAADGAMTMAGFGLGTLPATLAVGVFAGRGQAVLRSLSARRAAGAMVVAFGLWTFVAAAGAWQRSAATPGAVPSCHSEASAAVEPAVEEAATPHAG